MIQTLNEGTMPFCRGTYEQFEGLIASYCLTYYHFKNSSLKRERAKYEKLLSALNPLAERYGVQKPEDAIKNPRTDDPKWKPQKLTREQVLDNIFVFYRFFFINQAPNYGEYDVIKLSGVLNEIMAAA